jgi:hypothetical protein
MKSLIKKVNNVSQYWQEYDNDSAEFDIAFGDVGFPKSETMVMSFLETYVKLTLKYGIMIPPMFSLNSNLNIFDANLNIKEQITRLLIDKDKANMNVSFMTLYYCTPTEIFKDFIFSSMLYIQIGNSIALKNIANSDYLYTLEDIIKKKQDFFAPVVKMDYVNSFYISYRSDAFLYVLNNNKTDYCDIDNSDTAYLNTPRYNSFLRDFLNLCTEYGGKILFFCTESLKGVYSEQGILCDKEIVYYEDIYDLIPEEHRYKFFEEIQLAHSLLKTEN